MSRHQKARDDLELFLNEYVGVEGTDILKQKEDQIVDAVEAYFANQPDEPLDEPFVNDLIFELCDWPPLIKLNSLEDLANIIPEEVTEEFMPILYHYLEAKFPGVYEYQADENAIYLANSEEEDQGELREDE